MWELPLIGTPILVDINSVLVHAVVLAYFAKKEALIEEPYAHADKVYLRLVGLPVGDDCAVTTDVTFKVSHFKNMLRTSKVTVEKHEEMHVSLKESFKDHEHGSSTTATEERHEHMHGSLREGFKHFLHVS